MMDDHSPIPGDQQGQNKMILPGYPGGGAPSQPLQNFDTTVAYTNSRLRPPASPLGTKPVPPPDVLPKKPWRQDPAVLVLLGAIGLTIVATLIFAIIVGNSLFRPSTSNTPDNTGGAVSTVATATSTATPTPTSTPSPTPTATPTATPTPAPTSTPTPTPTPTGQPTLQLNNVPAQVNNNSTVTLNVVSNQPNVPVVFIVTYTNAVPTQYRTMVQTDANGNATINWPVAVFPYSKTVTAKVTARITTPSGQTVSSSSYTVKVNVGRGA